MCHCGSHLLSLLADEVERQIILVIERETVNDMRSGQHGQAYREVRKS